MPVGATTDYYTVTEPPRSFYIAGVHLYLRACAFLVTLRG